MRTQVIQDHNGTPTGVFIPIEDWEKMKEKYPDLESVSLFQLSDFQKEILDGQNDFSENDFQSNDGFIAELKSDYGL